MKHNISLYILEFVQLIDELAIVVLALLYLTALILSIPIASCLIAFIAIFATLYFLLEILIELYFPADQANFSEN